MARAERQKCIIVMAAAVMATKNLMDPKTAEQTTPRSRNKDMRRRIIKGAEQPCGDRVESHADTYPWPWSV